MNTRFINISIFIFLNIIFISSCTESNSIPYISTINKDTTLNISSDTVLVFQSGFEEYTHLIPRGTSGDDDILGYEPNLLKSNWNDLKTNDIKTVYFNYTGGDTTKRYTKIVVDPVNSNNKVLCFSLKNYWLTTDGQEKARMQLEFHEIKNGYKEFRQTVKAYLSADFTTLKTYPSTIDWLTLAEFWNNKWWNNVPNQFRITLNLHKDPGTGKDLQFSLTAQDSNFVNVWSKVNATVAVPISKWFTIEYYFKEGNKNTGRFYMAITPEGESKQIVFDVHDFTHGTKDSAPDGLTDYNPIKLYTSKEIVSFMNVKGKVLKIYWDDLRLWTFNNQ